MRFQEHSLIHTACIQYHRPIQFQAISAPQAAVLPSACQVSAQCPGPALLLSKPAVPRKACSLVPWLFQSAAQVHMGCWTWGHTLRCWDVPGEVRELCLLGLNPGPHRQSKCSDPLISLQPEASGPEGSPALNCAAQFCSRSALLCVFLLFLLPLLLLFPLLCFLSLLPLSPSSPLPSPHHSLIP